MFAVQNDGERFGLPLCALGSGAVHGLCVVALLPLIMLSGPSDGGTQSDALTIEVEVVTGSLPSVQTPRPSSPSRPPSREESGIESVRQDPDTDSAEQTERTSALPDPTPENALTAPAWPAPTQGSESRHEPPPSVTDAGQPDATLPPSAEIEISLPADAAKSDETSTDGPAADIAQPERADRSKPEPKVARIKQEPAKPETLSAAKPSTAAKAAKPKPAARRTKVQRKVVQSPGKATSGLQTLFKNLGKSRANSKPKRAKSGSGTGPRSAPASKSAPTSKGNEGNPLYFR